MLRVPRGAGGASVRRRVGGNHRELLGTAVADVAARLGHHADVERLLGVLLAAGLAHPPSRDFFTRARQLAATTDDAALRATVAQSVTDLIGCRAVADPDLLAPLLQAWLRVAERLDQGAYDDMDTGQSGYGDARTIRIHRITVPTLLLHLSRLSMRNRCALNDNGTLSMILPLVISDGLPSRDAEELEIYRELALELCQDGFAQLADVAALYRRAHTDLRASNLLLRAITVAKGPPCIQFDLSASAFSCIELPCLGKDFPPAGGGTDTRTPARHAGKTGIVNDGPAAASSGVAGAHDVVDGRGFDDIGYTLMLWVRFDAFDPHLHTTLFGAFDAQQTRFILLYLDRTSRHLVLQTALSGPRASVQFATHVFEPGKWYHIALVHKRRSLSPPASRANLFVNGEFVEQAMAEYPAATTPHLSSPLSLHPTPVQCFLGTPEDLAPASEAGQRPRCLRWSLARAVLFDRPWNDDIIAVLFHLGPRYQGNYQDCLGSFQTYQASAALNLRNESLHPGKDEDSDIVTVIRRKASLVIPEASILLSFSPTNVLDLRADRLDWAPDGDGGEGSSGITGSSRLRRLLSRRALHSLVTKIAATGNPVILNSAVTSVNDALTSSRGVGMLTGDPAVCLPHNLDDSSWQLGGCAAVHLSMVEAARTPAMLLNAVEILFEAVADNWRNSEAMERERGYEVLAVLISEKLGLTSGSTIGTSATSSRDGRPTSSSVSLAPAPRERSWSASAKVAPALAGSIQPIILASQSERTDITYRLLTTILKFVGYNPDDTQRSCMTNPLAYRMLIVDTEIWRMADKPVVELYYDQFTSFAMTSQYHNFNARRLSRMRTVKKFIEALKGEPVTTHTLGPMMRALRTILVTCMSAENLRVVALYITYAVHKPRAVLMPSTAASGTTGAAANATGRGLRPRRSSRFDTRARRIGPPLVSQAGGEVLTRSQVGVEVLRIYTDILSDGDGASTTIMRKFSRAVTNKWLLYLISEDDPDVVLPAAKILARSLVLQGPAYVTKFAEKNGGFITMRERYRRWWHVRSLWVACFSILLGRDVATVCKGKQPTMQETYEPFTTLFAGRNGLAQAEVVYPEVLPVLMAMLRSGLKACASRLHERPEQSVCDDLNSLKISPLADTDTTSIGVLSSAIDFLRRLHSESPHFRTFAITGSLTRELASVIYPITVGSDTVPAELELTSHSSALTMGGNAMPSPSGLQLTVVNAADVAANPRASASSFVVLGEHEIAHGLSFIADDGQPDSSATPERRLASAITSLTQDICMEDLATSKDYLGIDLAALVPPGFVEHQRLFTTWLVGSILRRIRTKLLDTASSSLAEPRVLTNLSRLLQGLRVRVADGSLIDGDMLILDFLGPLLEQLQEPEIASMKSVRLCHHAIKTMRGTLFSMLLHRLSAVEDKAEVLALLKRLTYWQTVLLAGGNDDVKEPHHLHLLCYHIYAQLVSPIPEVRLSAATFFRLLLVQKPAEMDAMVGYASSSLQTRLTAGFHELVGIDDANFLAWIDAHRDDMDAFFFGSLARAWDNYTRGERTRMDESVKVHLEQRKATLRAWADAELSDEQHIRKHVSSFDFWTTNISGSEVARYIRATQDWQDHLVFARSMLSRMKRELAREHGILAAPSSIKWRLDQTEGRSRMRRRVIPDDNPDPQDYQPKHKAKADLKSHAKDVSPRLRSSSNVSSSMAGSLGSNLTKQSIELECNESEDHIASGSADAPPSSEEQSNAESFELVDDPFTDLNRLEDKNRKVMRSIKPGD
ncbi:hypothetical protein KEM52_006314, partial [Ascosphaera acerosa]